MKLSVRHPLNWLLEQEEIWGVAVNLNETPRLVMFFEDEPGGYKEFPFAEADVADFISECEPVSAREVVEILLRKGERTRQDLSDILRTAFVEVAEEKGELVFWETEENVDSKMVNVTFVLQGRARRLTANMKLPLQDLAQALSRA